MDRSPFAEAIRAEANRALVRGGRYATILGLLGGLLVAAVSLLGLARDLWLPCGFALVAAACSFAIYLVARRGRLWGPLAYATLLPFVCLPTLFFVATHFVLPGGAATYLTGPIAHLYVVLVVITGFLFDPRLSMAAGALAALGYFACFLLARTRLPMISSSDPATLQDLVSPAIYAIKAFIICFSGVFVAGLTLITRRLLRRVLDEAASKERISRLFGEYVSDEVKEKIIGEKTAVVGERRTVAVLFCDIRGFTTFSERNSPERIVERLNEYFAAMVDCVSAEGGTVDKFIGDAIMAVFGGVLPLPSSCSAALRAARRMRQRLGELNAAWAAQGLEPFENGIGIHHGEVLQGTIGSPRRKEFTVIGDTVNTASRVEGLCKGFPHRVLITAEVHAALAAAERDGCRSLGRAQVKGRHEEIEIFAAD